MGPGIADMGVRRGAEYKAQGGTGVEEAKPAIRTA